MELCERKGIISPEREERYVFVKSRNPGTRHSSEIPIDMMSLHIHALLCEYGSHEHQYDENDCNGNQTPTSDTDGFAKGIPARQSTQNDDDYKQDQPFHI